MKIGFWGLLALILITLKIMGYITLSWFWVIGIITLPLTIALLVFAFAFYKLKMWNKWR